MEILITWVIALFFTRLNLSLCSHYTGLTLQKTIPDSHTKFKNPLDNIYSPQNLLPHLCYSHQALVSGSARRKYTDCNCIYTQK